MMDIVERLRVFAEFKNRDEKLDGPNIIHEAADEIELLRKERDGVREALKASVATIDALYEHLERVEKAGGATSIEGVAACHIMLKSMRKNANRVEELVMKPARAALKDGE